MDFPAGLTWLGWAVMEEEVVTEHPLSHLPFSSSSSFSFLWQEAEQEVQHQMEWDPVEMEACLAERVAF